MENKQEDGVRTAIVIVMLAYGTAACLIGAAVALTVTKLMGGTMLPAGW